MTEHTTTLATHDSARAKAVARFCAERRSSPPVPETRSRPEWQAVRQAGSALWLDSGDIGANREVWTEEFSAFTTNNTLLNKEVQKGTYDDLVPEAASVLREADPDIDDNELVLEIAFILNAVHGSKLARDFDATVCVELHTDLVHDAEASYQAGRRMHDLCPEDFVIKIANTPEGLIAARRLEDDGVPVNCTLGFSPRQNYVLARFSQPHFVNVFLGRVNSLIGGVEGVEAGPYGEAATIASQRLLRFLALNDLAAGHTRQIAASMRSGEQVPALAGVDVLTMPVDAAREFLEADVSPEQITDRTEEDPTLAYIDSPPAIGTECFWKVEEVFSAAVDRLLDTAMDSLDGPRIRAVFKDHYLADLYPDFSEEELERIAGDGKIPSWSAWEEQVADKRVSWDALLTQAGLLSFAADQEELDRRIRDSL